MASNADTLFFANGDVHQISRNDRVQTEASSFCDMWRLEEIVCLRQRDRNAKRKTEEDEMSILKA